MKGPAVTADPKTIEHPYRAPGDPGPNPLADGVRLDAWVNFLTGLGLDGRTKFEFTAPCRLTDQQLDDLYYGDPYAARVVDCVPEEAMRRGCTFRLAFGEASGARGMNSTSDAITGDPQKSAEQLQLWFDSHHLLQKTREAFTWARAWGGGFLLLGVNDGHRVDEPLDLKNAKEFLFAASCDKTELQPIDWYDDPERANFGEPCLYQLVRQAGISIDARQIHATRVIRFDGSMTTRRRRLTNSSWSESVLQRVYGSLRQFNAAYAAVSTLLQEASLRTIGMKDLARMMAADSGNQLKQRLAIMDNMTSVARAVLYDKDFESVSRVEVGALSGLSDALRSYIVYLSGAAHIPVTVLMGQAPAGLNATGDSDMRQFYDRIAAERPLYLTPKLIRLATVVCACDDGPTNGVVPRIAVDWPSMYAPTPAEEADIRLKNAQADQIYLATGVLTPEEVATSRFRPSGYSNEIVIDLQDHQVSQPDDDAASEDAQPTKDAAATPVPLTRSQVDGAAQIVERVAQRTISRDAGIAMLGALGLDPARAEAVMGETGKTHFTAPAPDLEQKHIALQLEHNRLKRSNASTKSMLAGVLARAKAKGLDIPPIARREPGREDETDDDVDEGLQGSAQMKPMPEGPPYTPKPVDETKGENGT